MKQIRKEIEESQRQLIKTMKDYCECHYLLLQYQKLGSLDYLKELVKKDKEAKNG